MSNTNILNNPTQQQVIKELKKGKEGYGLLIEHDGYASLEDEYNKNIREGLKEAEYINDWKIPYPFIVDVVLTKYNTPNANKRIYSEDILKREIDLFQNKIKTRSGFGEYSHPDDSTLNGERFAILIRETSWMGKTCVGKLELLMSYDFMKTGRIGCLGDLAATQLFFQNLRMGVSTRGLGSVNIDRLSGLGVVGNDFSLITWDLVSEPSSRDSWICPNKDDISLYIENQGKTPILENKIEKLDRLILI